MMKRGREDDDHDNNGSTSSTIVDQQSCTNLELMANCLVQISKGPLWRSAVTSVTNTRYCNNVVDKRMFECKTCGRVFNSFQALGGHRASHHKKKPKMDEENYMKVVVKAAVKVTAAAKTVHECSICGIQFPIGQALGGHMRRHRVNVDDDKVKREVVVVMSGDDDDDDHEDVKKMVPILMRSLSKNKRVMCMDLNLTPLENDLQILFGKKAPKVDCKLVV